MEWPFWICLNWHGWLGCFSFVENTWIFSVFLFFEQVCFEEKKLQIYPLNPCKLGLENLFDFYVELMAFRIKILIDETLIS